MLNVLVYYIEYVDTHTKTSLIASMVSFGLSYINIDINEIYVIYVIILELLRFIILFFGAITAILTFYSKVVKKWNKK